VVTVTGIENVVGLRTVTLNVPLMSGTEFDPLIVTRLPVTKAGNVTECVMTVEAATVLAVMV
jgi:hypothetical protein